jgi:hypothetical protein
MDEAVEACRPLLTQKRKMAHEYSGEDPSTLRGRMAWIEAQRGDFPERLK